MTNELIKNTKVNEPDAMNQDLSQIQKQNEIKATGK